MSTVAASQTKEEKLRAWFAEQFGHNTLALRRKQVVAAFDEWTPYNGEYYFRNLTTLGVLSPLERNGTATACYSAARIMGLILDFAKE